MAKTEEFLSKIRELKGLKHAILCGITVAKREKKAEFALVTDLAYSEQEEETAQNICAQYVPKGFFATIKIAKRVPDEEMLKNKIFAYLYKTFPAAAAFITADDIEIEMLGSGAHFSFRIASGEQTLFSSGKILDEVSRYLSSVFCGAFYGDVKIVERALDESILDELPEEKEESFVQEIRRFDICDFKKIDGADTLPKSAVYIADMDAEEGTYAVCGTIIFIEEKEYVKHNDETGEDIQKSRFSISISDGSGNLRTTYFPKKATVEKVRELKAGDSVVLIGSNEEFRGNMSFKATKINFGNQPEGFVPVAKKSKPVPKFYHTVFPEKYVDYTQTGLFDKLCLPQDLTHNTFVVFDLETTGLNNQPTMGKMDKIIEIGAVKIVAGEIVEKFSSFVACNEKLPANIVELTGICDADLVGAPTIDKVIPDFYKFADGAYLVGHNVMFDYRFIKYYAEECGYSFEQKQIDTVALSQELLRGEVVNNKLNTVAAYFGLEFNHHRAYEDASTTAKIFIEFIKMKGKL